jgi:hypothetical protein
MEKFLKTTLMVLGVLVLAALLFNLGIQLYWMIASPAWGGYGQMVHPMMMGWRGGMHGFGGFGPGFGLLGPILGIALVGLIVAGIVALVRGGRSSGGSTPESGSNPGAGA